ncbi:hypothetical protein AMTRI_Chr08g163580 [Amborella trichopoda]
MLIVENPLFEFIILLSQFYELFPLLIFLLHLQVIRLSNQGANAKNIFYLREIEYASELREAVGANKNGKAVVAGGRYIVLS